jgi:hypothetical protein
MARSKFDATQKCRCNAGFCDIRFSVLAIGKRASVVVRAHFRKLGDANAPGFTT